MIVSGFFSTLHIRGFNHPFSKLQATNSHPRAANAKTWTNAQSLTPSAASTPSAKTRLGRTGASASQDSGSGMIPGTNTIKQILP